MFGKVIVFRLFEMFQKKKKRVRTVSPGPGLAFGLGRVRRCGPSHSRLKAISPAF